MQAHVMTGWLKEKRHQHVGRHLLLASTTLVGGWLAAFLTFLAVYEWMPMNLSEDLTRISSTLNAEIK
jgi:hypothetical protein